MCDHRNTELCVCGGGGDPPVIQFTLTSNTENCVCASDAEPLVLYYLTVIQENWRFVMIWCPLPGNCDAAPGTWGSACAKICVCLLCVLLSITFRFHLVHMGSFTISVPSAKWIYEAII